MDIEGSGTSCPYDGIRVYDGAEYSRLIDTICGYSIPRPIRSSGSELFLRFYTDGSVTGRGFEVRIVGDGSTTGRLTFSTFTIMSIHYKHEQ